MLLITLLSSHSSNTMNIKQNNTLDALKGAYVFLTTNPIPSPLQNPSTGLNDQITALKSAIDDADAQATSQLSGTLHQSLKQRDALRIALRRQHLEPILQVARELDPSSPGLPNLVNLRSARTSQGLLNAVQAVLRDLPPYKDLLVAKGLPADFLDQLQTALTTYETATAAARKTKTARVQARAGIDTALQKGDSCKRIIGAIIRRAVPTDPDGQTFLRGWESASHVRRGKSSTTSTNEPTTTTNTQTTTTSPSTTSTSSGNTETSATQGTGTPTSTTPVTASPQSTAEHASTTTSPASTPSTPGTPATT